MPTSASAPRDDGPAPPSAPAPRPAGPLALPMRLLRYFFLDAWLEIDREAREERAALAARGVRLDARPMWVLVAVCLVLVLQEYVGDRPFFYRNFGDLVRGPWAVLWEFAWWSGSKVVGYVLLPLGVLLAMRFPLSECGLRWTGTKLAVYFWLYLAVLPVVVIASFTAPFQHTYPFYKLAGRSETDLIAWEAMYGASFFALEFFFRGFLLFPLRRSLGPYAIFAMDVPYCMIHFHKPVAEVVGAIFAGVLLGSLAMRTRSICGGVLLHVAVAWTMDILSIWQQGGFPLGRMVGG